MEKGALISHVCSHQELAKAAYMGAVVHTGILAAVTGTEHVARYVSMEQLSLGLCPPIRGSQALLTYPKEQEAHSLSMPRNRNPHLP